MYAIETLQAFIQKIVLQTFEQSSLLELPCISHRSAFCNRSYTGTPEAFRKSAQCQVYRTLKLGYSDVN